MMREARATARASRIEYSAFTIPESKMLRREFWPRAHQVERIGWGKPYPNSMWQPGPPAPSSLSTALPPYSTAPTLEDKTRHTNIHPDENPLFPTRRKSSSEGRPPTHPALRGRSKQQPRGYRSCTNPRPFRPVCPKSNSPNSYDLPCPNRLIPLPLFFPTTPPSTFVKFDMKLYCTTCTCTVTCLIIIKGPIQ
jgi:hypothetical protein